MLFLLDEFGTIGRLSCIERAYGLMRGAGISMWCFWQDLNQAKRDYGDSWETFVGNATAIVFFGVMDHFTVNYFSKMMGTRTVRYSTTSESRGETTRIPDKQPDYVDIIFGVDVNKEVRSGGSTTTNTTEHVVAQPLCSPDQIQRMHRSNLIVLSHGAPAVVGRVEYFRDAQLSAWARPDPKYAR